MPKAIKFGTKLMQFLRIPARNQEIQLFLEKHPDYSLNDEMVTLEGVHLKPLDFAIRYNNFEVVRMMLERGATPYNHKFAGPVAAMLRRDNIQNVPEKMRTLFQFGYSPNFYDQKTEHTPISDLLTASSRLSGDTALQLLRTFIEYGFNTDGMSDKAVNLFEQELDKLKRSSPSSPFVKELSEYYEIFLVKQRLEQIPEANQEANRKMRI